MTVSNFKDLKVWQLSKNLVVDLYRVTSSFPKQEVFGITAQIRRSAVSIPSNIAEGFFRHGKKDYAHFISMALGSASELETQLIIAGELEFLENKDAFLQRIDEIQKMLHGLRRAILSS